MMAFIYNLSNSGKKDIIESKAFPIRKFQTIFLLNQSLLNPHWAVYSDSAIKLANKSLS